ncbi:pyridoxal phosphate enzyme, YggS family [Xenococcus sp. PCC 7305]|uniref:YggS family pyridoxal phosphate-dependent enzyme n=1 Tax=Xenococcus sp. PCC 7305 TaxID=102125 RepID=UPI0002ABC55A|nr:YggS family pyridoxal phosphate-dependent enzyme [Xenococcus sp. PCC 7305]ELS02597.1 pyridoxal phosphate enzyme, YggS family [Xenococcus sp. PCC 7305]
MAGEVAKRIGEIKQKVPPHVRLIAVSKQVSADAMRIAYEAGVRDFAENRLQEAIAKQEQLQDLTDICWHFIGHIQTKKARKIMANFHWIHSIDSLKLAEKINALAVELENKPQLLLQVKPLADPNKYGWQIEELLRDLPVLDGLKNIQIKGLMTILPWGLAAEKNLIAFKMVQELAEKIRQQNYSSLHMQELSMGMSGDYPLAIQAGSTMIRPGRIIFGER